MNKEVIVTSEDIELLKEMKHNSLKSDVYDDEKRLLKANAITKVLNENEKLHSYKTLYQSLKKQNDELKEDISFCLKSIKQEMEMSTDSRTRGEMESCYEILERWNK